ncbi:MAG: knotted carbamoyltransferase YgeW, partial [Elusimicrobia bacterium]|nr:knotted carbamoyltransferase YgeW [Elusimicrobiota bacterium]
MPTATATQKFDLKKAIAELEKLGADLYHKDFLLTWEKNDAEIHSVLKIAEILKEMHAQNIDASMFRTGLAVSNFRDNSTRTRFSFASACNLLGLAVQDLDEG